MGRLGWMLLISAWAAAAAGVTQIREDAPVATQPQRGEVAGQITPAERIARIDAVCRATGERHRPASFDPKTGRFAFRKLAGDAAYDVCVVAKDGAHIEGIDLSWHEARMLRLAEIRRRQLGLPAEAQHEFSAGDAEELLKYVRDLKDFADVRRVLYLNGLGRRAAMLVEVMRTREFHAQRGGEIIWRTELWYFQYHYGGWERLGQVERVLERRRIPASEWQTITKVYYPQLSVYVGEKGVSQPLTFRIPDRLDPARGRIAGTEPGQKTEPIILGVKEEKAPATTAASGP
ncbi:MAG: hypothetical protein AMJ81_11470 [Phycisphaerae bacterium SM23_33]|jgi:hypothetical protein|nr:MAG: hypothetical protein AMJ81_11470 [Phycisphaerae bacterium SM23_33]